MPAISPASSMWNPSRGMHFNALDQAADQAKCLGVQTEIGKGRVASNPPTADISDVTEN